MFLGCHLSISKGFENIAQTAIKINANTFQFFTRNPRGGRARSVDLSDIKKMNSLLEKNNFGPIVAHAPYTLNPCSQETKNRDFASLVLQEDLILLENIPNCFYNFHPGSHVGNGKEVGIQRTSDLLNDVITSSQKTQILIETMSGQGSEIGSSFEEIAQIIEKTHSHEKIGVCLDTCHVFAAGYDIIHHLDNVLTDFDKIIGLTRLKAIHLNDSLKPFGSHKDRHARIGAGEIGLFPILNIIKHPLLKNLPFILETPNDSDGYFTEINLLKEKT